MCETGLIMANFNCRVYFIYTCSIYIILKKGYIRGKEYC